MDRIGSQVYSQTPSTLNSVTVEQKYATIFEWIPIFTTNIYIILMIMIFVGAINMITALLVLILERTQMIGILKSLGAPNFSIRKVFILKSAFLIGKGILLGNLMAILLSAIQIFF